MLVNRVAKINMTRKREQYTAGEGVHASVDNSVSNFAENCYI